MNILLENKKDIINKLKDKYPNDGDFIDRMFSIDKTPKNKYALWIGKYLENSLKFKNIDGEIEKMINFIIPNFEKNYTKIDDDIIEDFIDMVKSGGGVNDKILEDINKIVKSPKDINSYSAPYYILLMLKSIEKSSIRKEKERAARKDVDKLYEDSNYLVLKPRSYEASCYYGRQTRWCTSSIKTDTHFNSYTSRGTLIYFIDKKNIINGKVALFLEKNGGKTEKSVFDALDIQRSIDFLYDSFPELSGLIDKITGNFKIPELLNLFVSGEIGKDEILNIEFVSKVIVDEKNRKNSVIEFDFDGQDNFIGFLDLTDDDKYVINSYYGLEGYFGDTEYEWGEGYILPSFNNENMGKVREILKIVSPIHYKSDLTDNDISANVSQILLKMFKSEITGIISSYEIEYRRAVEKNLGKVIDDELCNVFKKDGIEKVGDNCFYLYETTIGNLINLFVEYNPKKQTIKSLLKTISKNYSLGGWSEYLYDYVNMDYFNDHEFQKDVDYELDKIIDEISENENVGEYLEIFNTLNDKYEIGVWYALPRNKDYRFIIEKINIDDLSIEVRVGGKTFKKYKLSNLNEFYSLLFNYKLFESIKSRS